jgi:hypothetical protein
MLEIRISKEELARVDLGRERDELLSVLADDDLYLRDRRFLLALVKKRLLEIEAEHARKVSDAGEYSSPGSIGTTGA